MYVLSHRFSFISHDAISNVHANQVHKLHTLLKHRLDSFANFDDEIERLVMQFELVTWMSFVANK